MYSLSKVVFIALMMTTVIGLSLALNKNRFGWFVSGMLLGFAYAISGWLI